MWIHWWDEVKGVKVDNGRLKPGAIVRLLSEHHLDPPEGYEIKEQVPKFLVKWLGTKFKKVTRSDAFPENGEPLTSTFWSEPWALAGPANQKREVVYRPSLEGSATDTSSVEAAIIRCSYLFVEKSMHRHGADLKLRPELKYQGGAVVVGEAGASFGSETTFAATAPVDPQVEISVVQGDALLRHLTDVSREFQGNGQVEQSFLETLAGAAAEYFVAAPLSPEGSPVVGILEPAVPLRIDVRAPHSDELRAAFAVKIWDPEADHGVVTDPVFLTSVRGEIIAADLPRELLDDESVEILELLDDARGSVSALASRTGTSTKDVWTRVVAATRELGTANVGEAVNLIGSLVSA
jgi:hypothetical protein